MPARIGIRPKPRTLVDLGLRHTARIHPKDAAVAGLGSGDRVPIVSEIEDIEDIEDIERIAGMALLDGIPVRIEPVATPSTLAKIGAETAS